MQSGVAHGFRTVLSILLVALLTGCDGGDDDRGDDGQPELGGPRLEVNEARGTVNRVGLGDGRSEIVQVFGEAPPHTIYKAATPLGVDPVDLTLDAEGGGCRELRGREDALRYRGVSFFLYGDEVCEIFVTSGKAKLRGNVKPGDSIERVSQRYAELECGETNVGHDEPSFEPACWGRTGKGSFIWFGGDPINVVGLTSGPLRPDE